MPSAERALPQIMQLDLRHERERTVNKSNAGARRLKAVLRGGRGGTNALELTARLGAPRRGLCCMTADYSGTGETWHAC